MTDLSRSAPSLAPTIGSVARVWLVTLAAGAAAALFTWAAGESLRVEEIGRGSRGAGMTVSPVAQSARNAIMGLTLLGGSLGVCLGMAGGVLRRMPRSASHAGLGGGFLGAAVGFGASRVLVPLYYSHYSSVSLTVPLLVHGGIWTSIALAAGLAFGMGIGGPGRAIEAAAYAIAGALFATFSYEFAGVWLFPAAQTDRPLPASPESRMFAYLIVALMVGAALAFGASRRRPSIAVPAPVAS